jgi:hypothetical protein
MRCAKRGIIDWLDFPCSHSSIRIGMGFITYNVSSKQASKRLIASSIHKPYITTMIHWLPSLGMLSLLMLKVAPIEHIHQREVHFELVKISNLFAISNWGGRIRTSAWRYQKPLPYRLATPHKFRSLLH